MSIVSSKSHQSLGSKILVWFIRAVAIPMLILAPALPTSIAMKQHHEKVRIGDTICAHGYIMDSFCIERGSLFDNPTVSTLGPEGPLVHTVHCLIDVSQCVQSPFEILYDLGNDDDYAGRKERAFGRAWRVTNNSLLVAHAKEVGKCDECSGDQVRGLTATIFGQVLDLGSSNRPSLIRVESVENGDVGCGSAVYEVPNMII